MATMLKNGPSQSKDLQGNFPAFYKWANTAGVDFADAGQVEAAKNVFFGGGYESDLHTDKQGWPPADRPTGGWLYDDGPFTYNGMQDGLFNQAINGGSPLVQWIPTEPMQAKKETMAYFDYIVPEGWNGQSYIAFLNTLNVGACDYGPSTAWHGHEMSVGFGEWSVSTPTLHRYDFGLKMHQNTPTVTIRGNNGQSIENDAQWAVARLAVELEQHLETIMRYGTLGGTFQMDGLTNLITMGYVQQHLIGSQKPVFANPLYYDGTNLVSIADILEIVRSMVRKIVKRASQRNWSIGPMDMIILVPGAIWPYMLDAIACGANTTCSSSNLSYVINDARQERQRAATGGLGYGMLEVDNMRVPVLPDDGFGKSYNLSGQNYTTGDIFVLTRRVNGVTVLSQQYLNFGMLDLPQTGNWWLENGGITRAGWIDINEKCWFGFAEQTGRTVCRMLPLQGRIMSVSVANVLENETEQGWVLSDSFYALQDQDPLKPWGSY